jgi:hypothetical protein
MIFFSRKQKRFGLWSKLDERYRKANPQYIHPGCVQSAGEASRRKDWPHCC